MKTLIICIMAAVISTSYGSFLSALLGGDGQNQGPPPQKFLHHHHHQHEVLHKSIVADHHPWDNSNAIHKPVAVHPEHVQIYKIVYENGGHGHHQLGRHDIGHDHGHGPVYHHAPPHVITKVVQPVLNKNFIHNSHEHHYHQHHDVSGHGYQHHGNGWD